MPNPTTGLSGPALAAAAGGALLVYVGIKGTDPLTELRGIIGGRRPEPLARTSAAAPLATDQWTSGTIGTPAAGPFGQAVAREALAQLGKPYRWGGKGPDRFDCSGLVFWCFRRAGATGYGYLTSWGIARSSDFRKVDRSAVAAGDVLWKPGHVAIAISGTELVEAYRTGLPVRRASIDQRFSPGRLSPVKYLRYVRGAK